MTTTTTPPVRVHDEALAAIPRYLELNQAQARAQTLLASARAGITAQPHLEVLQGVYRDLVAGEHVDLDDLVRELTARAQSLAAAQQAAQGIGQVLDQLKADTAEAIARGVDAGLEVLARHLAAVIDQVRELDKDLGPITTADEAIAADQTQAWRELILAIDRYDEIRTAQLHLVAAVTRGSAASMPMLNTAGLLRDGLGVWPPLRARAGEDNPRAAWPAPVWQFTNAAGGVTHAPEVWRWPSEDRPAYLRWVTTTTEPWLPTYTELVAHAEDLEAGIRRRNAPGAPQELG